MLYIAIRQMMSKKSQTILIFLGISFGTMIYVVIAGIQFGFREYLSEQLLNNTAHVIIKGNERYVNEADIRNRTFDKHRFIKWIVPPYGKREESRLENPAGWFERLQKDPNVVAFAPRLTIDAIVTKSSNRQNVTLSGIIPQRQVKITSLEEYMLEGSLLNLSGGGNKIVLGSGVMKLIGARMGETISVSTGLGGSRPFKIVGNLHLGNEQMDEVFSLAHISDVQSINRTPGRVSEISVAIFDMELAEEIADRWSIYTKDTVEGWQEANAQFMEMINIQDIVRLVITTSILIVAGFGIYNVLSIMINQKQKEIAILRSIGYAPSRILELFLVQGLILGFFGGLMGLIFGHSLNLFIESIELGFEIGKSNHMLISYRPSIYITAFVAAQVSATIASILPARKAAKMTPLDIIRANI